MPITTSIRDKVAHVHFDDGGLNIITPVIATEFLQVVEAIDANQAVECLLIEGNGRSFSAGLDDKVIRAGGEQAAQLLLDTGKLLRTLYRSRLRVVSLCAGHATAAGAMLLLVSDHRVGVKGSGRIGFTEVAHGIVLQELAVLLAQDRLNQKEQFAATVLSKLYSHTESKEAGFIDVVFDQFKEARYSAQQAALQLAQLDSVAYHEMLLEVRKKTLAVFDEL